MPFGHRDPTFSQETTISDDFEELAMSCHPHNGPVTLKKTNVVVARTCGAMREDDVAEARLPMRLHGFPARVKCIGTHTGLAVTEEGEVFKWTVGSPRPAGVAGLNGVVAVSAGDHTSRSTARNPLTAVVGALHPGRLSAFDCPRKSCAGGRFPGFGLIRSCQLAGIPRPSRVPLRDVRQDVQVAGIGAPGGDLHVDESRAR